LTLPILVGTDGHMRMSKTTGNYVAIGEPPEEQYGKAMSIPDEAMANWFNLVTTWSPEDIRGLMASTEAGEIHPMDAKKRLADEIVRLFHGPEMASEARAHFERTVQGGKLPRHMPTQRVVGATGLLDLITGAGFASSNSEARRLVKQGGVRIDDETIDNPGHVVEPGPERILQVGKRRFLKLQ
jgi:tyrosyl-tRNA synthetase